MYILGEGVPTNYVRAIMWWALAKAQGYENAAGRVDKIKEEMTSAQIGEAQKLAAEMWEKINN